MSAVKIIKVVEGAATAGGSMEAELKAEMKILRMIQEEQKMKMKLPAPPTTASTVFKTAEEQKEIDAKSIFINNLDFGAATQGLEDHFKSCGKIARITILRNKFTGQAKGAYIQFEEQEAVKKALQLNNTICCGRRVRVSEKRTNVPGMRTTGRPVYHRGAATVGGRGGNPYVFRAEGYGRAKATFKPY